MLESDSDAKKEMRSPKAVALLSGGLDSSLAVRMMLEQGIEVEAVAIKTPFCDFDCGKGCGHRVKEVATELGIKLKTVYFGDEYLKMLKNPKYGYGSGMNPCIDCRGMMYTAAKKHMESIEADFIITGEVLSQRPMSQHKSAFHIIENETDTKGIVLRPLSAKQLEETDVEKNGLVKRDLLSDIKGRSRKGQLQLAQKYDIDNPPNAAGGCLLTDPAFSKRIKDLMSHSKDIPSMNDVELLKIGRHIRLDGNTKLIVGRNHQENEMLQSYRKDKDLLLEVDGYVGPTSIFRFNSDVLSSELLDLACGIVIRYSDAPKDRQIKVKIIGNTSHHEIITTSSVKSEVIDLLRI